MTEYIIESIHERGRSEYMWIYKVIGPNEAMLKYMKIPHFHSEWVHANEEQREHVFKIKNMANTKNITAEEVFTLLL